MNEWILRGNISLKLTSNICMSMSMMSPTEFFGQKSNAYNISSDLGENTENNIFKLKLHKHGKSVVIAQQTVLSSRNCPEDFQIVMSFLPNDDNADDDIESISGTCGSQAWILSIDIRQESNRQIKLQTVYWNWRSLFNDPTPSFPRLGITWPKPLDEGQSGILRRKKTCGQSVNPASQNTLPTSIQICSSAQLLPGSLQDSIFPGSWLLYPRD